MFLPFEVLSKSVVGRKNNDIGGANASSWDTVCVFKQKKEVVNL